MARRPRVPSPYSIASAALIAIAVLASGCVPVPPVKPPPALAELMQRPAERALIEGIRHYDDGHYALAEVQLRKALTTGLIEGIRHYDDGHYALAEVQLRKALTTGLIEARDRASAHKLLAFITCTTERMADCAAQFSAARAADPQFQLSRSEMGHPVWGPVYRRTLPPSPPPPPPAETPVSGR